MLERYMFVTCYYGSLHFLLKMAVNKFPVFFRYHYEENVDCKMRLLYKVVLKVKIQQHFPK